MPRHSKNSVGETHQQDPHTPVLQDEVLQALKPAPGESYMDTTAGYGGHAEAILKITRSPERAVLIDRDGQAAEHLMQKFGKAGARVIRKDYLSASRDLAEMGEKYDMILADLGVSSPHLDQPERGFSFRVSGPLDMRMDSRQQLSADEIVNQWPEEKLAQMIRDFGEEPKARKVASAIVKNRPIADTSTLAEIVSRAIGKRFSNRRIHPATRTFQAIRIAVNEELLQLALSLPVWEDLLAPGGRLAVISFHSLEDRVVKRYFAEHAQNTYDSELRLLTKKPLIKSKTKTDNNPRARSAKLRAAVKIKT